MISRFERLSIAVLFALLAAGLTLVIAQAQDGGPTPPAPQPSSSACLSCHADFVQAWQHGPHGQATSDPKFVAEWNQDGKPGACLVCHVTGYDPAKGTWQTDGVACEICHGPLKPDHPKEPMPVNSSPDLCARCHSGPRFDLQAWQQSAHFQSGMTCTTCHDPHSASLKVAFPLDGSAKYNDASELCINCHTDVSMDISYSVHHKAGVSCIECHVTHTVTASTDVHAMPDHSFQASLESCNKCHADQMHSPTQTAGTGTSGLPVQQIQQAGVTLQPSPASPIGFAGLAGLIGLAAGMVLAPSLEKWFHRVSKPGPEEKQ